MPSCASCVLFEYPREFPLPDIGPYRWEEDISWTFGEDELETIKSLVAEDPNFAFFCYHCSRQLRPWEIDDVYVLSYAFRDYNFPLSPYNRKKPSKAVRKRVRKLYGNKCFRCNKSCFPIHIDHIQPRTKGGGATFINLQSLCTRCGNLKANREATETTVRYPMYVSSG